MHPGHPCMDPPLIYERNMKNEQPLIPIASLMHYSSTPYNVIGMMRKQNGGIDIWAYVLLALQTYGTSSIIIHT